MKKTRWIESIYGIDIYGTRPQIRIGKSEVFHSGLGVIFTLISLFLIIGLSIKFGIALVDTTNPLTTLSVRNINDPPNYKLNKDNYGIILGLHTKFFAPLKDQSIYHFEAYQVKNNKSDNTWTNTPIQLEPCSLDNFEPKFQEVFASTDIENFICIKNNETINLTGTYISPIYEYLLVQIKQCVNVTDPNSKDPNSIAPNSIVCKSQKEIDEALSFNFFTFGHSDISIDPTNYTKPEKYFDGDKYLSVSNNYYQTVAHNTKLVSMETDVGWIFEDYQNNTILQNNNIEVNTEFSKTTLLLDYIIRLSHRIEIFKRRYTKVQDVAAQVGGLIKVFIVIFQTATSLYNSSKFYGYLTNQLFYLNDPDPSLGNIKNIKFVPNNNKNSSHQRINNDVASNKSRVVSSLQPKKFMEISIPRIRNFHQGSYFESGDSYQLKLSSVEAFYFAMPYCCYSNKNNNAKKLYLSSCEIKRRLDLVYILRKLNDIERMKKVIFNDDMLQLFNLKCREDLVLNDRLFQSDYENDMDPNLLNSYNRIKGEAETKDKVRKLLNVLDRNSINILNQ